MDACSPDCARPEINTLHDVASQAQIGNPAPDFSLPKRFQLRHFSELRGTPVIMVFSLSTWDPSAPGQLTFLKNLLAYCAPASVNLRELSFENDNYFLKFEAPRSATTIAVLRDFDPDGSIAQAYGLAGERAVVVVDGQGVVRERYLIPAGMIPRTDRLRQTLEKLGDDRDSLSAGVAGPAVSVNRREFVASKIAASLTLWIWPNVALTDQPTLNPLSP